MKTRIGTDIRSLAILILSAALLASSLVASPAQQQDGGEEYDPLHLPHQAHSTGRRMPLVAPVAMPPAHATRAVALADLAPTQFEAGFANVERMLQSLKDQAATAKTPWERFVTETVKPRMESAGKSLPAIVDPSGVVRPVDGHHRVLLMQMIEKEMTTTYGRADFRFRVPVEIRHDYRGRSPADWARDMERRGWGQFPDQLKSLPPAERYEQLPARFGDIKNSELRAILGDTLFQTRVDSRGLRPYVEFEMGNVLMRQGFVADLKKAGLLDHAASSLPEGLARNPQVTKLAIQKLLLDPACAAKLVDHGLGPAQQEAVRQALANAAAKAGIPPPFAVAAAAAQTATPAGKPGELRLLGVNGQAVRNVARVAGSHMMMGTAISMGAAAVPRVWTNVRDGRPITSGLATDLFSWDAIKTTVGAVGGSLAGLLVRGHPLGSLAASVVGGTLGAGLGFGDLRKNPGRVLAGAAGATLGAVVLGGLLSPVPGGMLVGSMVGGVLGQMGGEWLHDKLRKPEVPALRGAPFAVAARP